MSDALPALTPWCRELERVYRNEAGPLVEDTVKLIDRLNTITSTGQGVAKMRDEAQKRPASAAVVVDALRRGSLCSRRARGLAILATDGN